MKKQDVPLDASAKAVLERAREEAARLQHEYIGTEHLTLALLRLTPLTATRLLQDLEVDVETMRAAIESVVVAAASSAEPNGNAGFSTRTQRVFASAQQYAQSLGETAVGAEHLLVGLLQEPGVGGQMLIRHGLSAEAVLAALQD